MAVIPTLQLSCVYNQVAGSDLAWCVELFEYALQVWRS